MAPTATEEEDSPSLQQLVRQLAPLSLSDVAMAAADPLLAITLSRLPNATVELAALGVAKSLAVLFESPIIMVLHASTALSRDFRSRTVLRRFVLLVSAALTLGFLLLSVPAVFSYWTTHLYQLAPEVVASIRLPLLAMAFWPALIAWRRLHQGVLILQGRGAVMGTASLLRIAVLAGLLYAAVPMRIHGAFAGAVALMGGLLVETAICSHQAKRLGDPPEAPDDTLPSGMRSMALYYAPLAATMVVMWGGRAMLLGILSYSREGSLTLAAWAASWGFVIMIANLSRMVQQLVLKYEGKVPRSRLVALAHLSGGFTTLLILGLGYTSAGHALLSKLIGSDPWLLAASLTIVKLSVAVPILTAWQNLLQGLHIHRRHNRVLNWAAIAGLSLTLGSSAWAIGYELSGPATGALSLTAGLTLEVALLLLSFRYRFRL